GYQTSEVFKTSEVCQHEPIRGVFFLSERAHHSPIAEFVGQDLLLTTVRERHSVKEFPPAWVVDIGQTNLNF
ncbi:MAG: hypothetical protein MUO67_05790, partial [Anaerolineales bacterium]|nr:hypothetical protein [Anaerolineales bacterium]